VEEKLYAQKYRAEIALNSIGDECFAPILTRYD
jgi:hypothetical protein